MTEEETKVQVLSIFIDEAQQRIVQTSLGFLVQQTTPNSYSPSCDESSSFNIETKFTPVKSPDVYSTMKLRQQESPSEDDDTLTYERHIRQESQEFRNLAHIDPLFAVSSPARPPHRDESVGRISSSYQSSEAPLAYQSTPQPYSPGESQEHQRLLLAPLEESSKGEEEEAVMDLTLSNQSEDGPQPGPEVMVLD